MSSSKNKAFVKEQRKVEDLQATVATLIAMVRKQAQQIQKVTADSDEQCYATDSRESAVGLLRNSKVTVYKLRWREFEVALP